MELRAWAVVFAAGLSHLAKRHPIDNQKYEFWKNLNSFLLVFPGMFDTTLANPRSFSDTFTLRFLCIDSLEHRYPGGPISRAGQPHPGDG